MRLLGAIRGVEVAKVSVEQLLTIPAGRLGSGDDLRLPDFSTRRH